MIIFILFEMRTVDDDQQIIGGLNEILIKVTYKFLFIQYYKFYRKTWELVTVTFTFTITFDMFVIFPPWQTFTQK